MSKIVIGGVVSRRNEGARNVKGIVMAEVTIVYWRDIPAQVIVGKGRRGAKRQLPERFEQAIDRCAMKIGARDTDAYLAEWRKAAPVTVEGEDEAVATAEAERIDRDYDSERLKALIANDGWA
jgi:Virulence factor